MPTTCSARTIDRWKLDLVRARAFRLGFRGADLEDAQQEVLQEIVLFHFQADHANGANEKTALVALIDRRLCMILRQRRRYQKRLDRLQQGIDPESLLVDAEQTDHAERTARRLDIQKILAGFDPEDRALCSYLAAGESLYSIANRLQCSWHKVKRRIDHLRELLIETGVDGYVQ